MTNLIQPEDMLTELSERYFNHPDRGGDYLNVVEMDQLLTLQKEEIYKLCGILNQRGALLMPNYWTRCLICGKKTPILKYDKFTNNHGVQDVMLEIGICSCVDPTPTYQIEGCKEAADALPNEVQHDSPLATIVTDVGGF